MSKNGRGYSVCALILGVLGYASRYFVIINGFEPVTGLAVRGYFWTVALIIIGAAAIVFSVAAGVISKSQCEKTEMFDFSEKNKIWALGIISAVIIGIGGMLYYAECAANGVGNNFLYVLFSGLAVIGGICLGIVSVKRIKGAELKGTGPALSVLSVLFCLWLVLLYRENSTDPVLLTYCFTALALAFVSLSFYYTVGWFVKRKNTVMFIVSHFCSITFAIIAMADFGFGSEFWLLLGAAAASFAELYAFEKIKAADSGGKEK